MLAFNGQYKRGIDDNLKPYGEFKVRVNPEALHDAFRLGMDIPKCLGEELVMYIQSQTPEEIVNNLLSKFNQPPSEETPND